MEVTFNKAIDKTFNIIEEFKKLINTGIDRVLTSGGAKTAFNGRFIINDMVKISNGNVKIISAGKVHQADLSKLQKIIHVDEFHGKKIVGNLNTNVN